MTTYIAIKIHYDHRAALAPHLKYTCPPNSAAEYEEYLRLFREEGIGGDGFHECMNFARSEDGPVKIYLPPGYIPAEDRISDELVIFTFTYHGDREMPSRVIGVHAHARVVDRDGAVRLDVPPLEGIGPFFYHAEAPPEIVTLFNSAPKYDFRAGRHTPTYRLWGNGLRHLTPRNAKNIVDDASEAAREALQTAHGPRRLAIEQEIEVLQRITERYFGVSAASGARVASKRKSGGANPPPPDTEVGYLGEKFIYERELAYARSIGVSEQKVEWISRRVPSSPYDIKSVRKTERGHCSYYIEVKSSRVAGNVYISSGQIGFFEDHPADGIFVFVTFLNGSDAPGTRELTLEELLREFLLEPIKYRLGRRSAA
jgi:hypothetical protein